MLEAASAAAAGGSDPFASERLFADVKTYAEAGSKQSGGIGDRWIADWTARRLSDAGFAVERQSFDAPWFEAATSELRLGDRKIPLVAQPLAVPTGPGGIDAPLRLADVSDNLDGAIAGS